MKEKAELRIEANSIINSLILLIEKNKPENPNARYNTSYAAVMSKVSECQLAVDDFLNNTVITREKAVVNQTAIGNFNNQQINP